MGEAADVRGSAEGGRYEPAGVTHAGVRDVATRSTSKFYRYSVSRSRVAHGVTVASQRWFAIPIRGDTYHGFNGSGAVVSPIGEVKVDPHNSREDHREALAGRAAGLCCSVLIGWLYRWSVVRLPFPPVPICYQLTSNATRAGLVYGFWIRALCKTVIHGDVLATDVR